MTRVGLEKSAGIVGVGADMGSVGVAGSGGFRGDCERGAAGVGGATTVDIT